MHARNKKSAHKLKDRCVRNLLNTGLPSTSVTAETFEVFAREAQLSSDSFCVALPVLVPSPNKEGNVPTRLFYRQSVTCRKHPARVIERTLQKRQSVFYALRNCRCRRFDVSPPSFISLPCYRRYRVCIATLALTLASKCRGASETPKSGRLF